MLDNIYHKLNHEYNMTINVDVAVNMNVDMAINMTAYSDVDVTNDMNTDNSCFHKPVYF
jgi:hypothetical protein